MMTDFYQSSKELNGFVLCSFLLAIYIVNLCHSVSVLIFDNKLMMQLFSVANDVDAFWTF